MAPTETALPRFVGAHSAGRTKSADAIVLRFLDAAGHCYRLELADGLIGAAITALVANAVPKTREMGTQTDAQPLILTGAQPLVDEHQRPGLALLIGNAEIVILLPPEGLKELRDGIDELRQLTSDESPSDLKH